MEFKELMGQFGAKVGLSDLAPGDTGVCSVQIDEMQVSFKEDPASSSVMTWAEVGEPPPEGEAMLHRVLLQATFADQSLGGAFFSADPETGRIYLNRVDPTAVLDLDSFCRMLEKFVNALEQWRKTLADFRPVAEAIGEEGAAAPAPDIRPGEFLQV